jgi:hypothetical protein
MLVEQELKSRFFKQSFILHLYLQKIRELCQH